MNCPACNAEMESRVEAIGENMGGSVTFFKCGAYQEDGKPLAQSRECLLNELKPLRAFKAAVIAANSLATVSLTATAIRELCKGER